MSDTPEPDVSDPSVPDPSVPDLSVPDLSVPAPHDVPDPYVPDEDAMRLAEALVFASAGPVTARALSQLLPEAADADAVIAALRARYAGRGVELAEAGGGVMFRTAADLALRLRKVVQISRRLPRVAMETLAIVAYHQPVTRAEIEEIRGTSLAQQTLEALLEAGLIMLKGRRETPGRPAMWGTTPHFLAQFGLGDLRDLPRREDLLLELPIPTAAAAHEPAAHVADAQEGDAQEGDAQEGAGDASDVQEADASETEAASQTLAEPPGELATHTPGDASGDAPGEAAADGPQDAAPPAVRSLATDH
jgi:segregation and condensation protein B